MTTTRSILGLATMLAFFIMGLLLLLTVPASSQPIEETTDKMIPLDILKKRTTLVWEIESQTDWDKNIEVWSKAFSNYSSRICWHLNATAYDDLFLLSAQEYKEKYTTQLEKEVIISALKNYPFTLQKGMTANVSSIDISRMGCMEVFQPNKAGQRFTIGLGTITFVSVYTSGYIGYYASMAIDSLGRPHWAVQDRANLYLYYCNNNSGTVSCTNLDAGTNDRGYSADITIDKDDNIHIVHRDLTPYPDVVRYCTNTSGSFSCEVAWTTTTNGGFNNRIHIRADGNPTLTSNEGTTHSTFVSRKQGTWSAKKIPLLYVSQSSYDSNGDLHLAGYNYSTGDLIYCDNTSGTYDCDIIDSTTNYGGVQIYMSATDDIYLVAHDTTGDDLEYWVKPSGGAWSGTTIFDNADATSTALQIEEDCEGTIWIKGYAESNYYMILCNDTSSTMTCSNHEIFSVTNTYLGEGESHGIVTRKGYYYDQTWANAIYIPYYNNTNLEMIVMDQTCGADPCACPGAGNAWEWDFSENCVFDSNCIGITDITCNPGTSSNLITIAADIDANTYTCTTLGRISITSAGRFILSP